MYTAAEIIFALLQELTKEKAEQFAMNLWSLWKSQNLRIWQNISEKCQAISARAHHMLKCNIDAAFSEALNRVGFGLCIRDAAGNFRKAKMMWSNPICRPEIGEALSLLYPIQWVHKLQLTTVDFEMDANSCRLF